MVAWVLPGVLPGVTWRYLECYLVLPGRYLGCYFWMLFFCGPKIPASLKLKLLKNLETLPGPAPVLVTWLPGPPSELCLRLKQHLQHGGHSRTSFFGRHLLTSDELSFHHALLFAPSVFYHLFFHYIYIVLLL